MAENKENHLPDSPDGRWTEIELLPAWSEQYYDVFTAKKFGKWVMLKSLKKEYRDDPKYQQMFDKEFDARYDLAHPNIVMVNDLEEVPGIGRCIITDDVFGNSLRKLLDNGELTDRHYEQLKTRLPMAMEYIQQNHLAHHPIRPETILFTESGQNLKLIDVGFDQVRCLSHEDTNEDIINYGLIINEVLAKTGRRDPVMKRIADRCVSTNPKRRFRSVSTLQMAINGHSVKRLMVVIIVFLVLMVIALGIALHLAPTQV